MATVAAVLVLVVTNLSNNRWFNSWGLLTGALTVVVLYGLVRWAGGGRTELGLARGTLARGAAWALSIIGVVGAVYLAGALLPVTRDLFADQRNNALSGGELAAKVLFYVPFGTVLLEEFAFRGTLYGLVRRRHGTLWATGVSSFLFGLWHILPSLHLATEKPALTPVFGSSPVGAIVADAAAVVFTGLGGAVFCELRRRSSSLLAPMGMHWATNALGYIAAYATAHPH
ncbi:CPBP family intramembrane metalloprotease [Streptacidiphilus sp. P02-A3a]|nr:CPBP family intramembrane metalloprotease [Streptacidiphilus sp. P02-A3a]